MNLRDIFLHNFWYKVFSVMCGILLWFVVIGQQQSEISVELPLEYRNVPANYIMTRSTIRKVSVLLSGPSTLLKLVVRKELSFPVDLSHVHKGENEIALYPELLNLPHKITLRVITPATIKVYFEKIVSQEKPVIPRFKNSIAKGYKIAKVIVEPHVVKITAGEDTLKRISALETEKIDLKDRKENFEEITPLVINNLKYLKKIEPPEVKVKVLIEEKFVKKSIKNIKIDVKTNLNLEEYDIFIKPAKINIQYDISENFMNLIKRGDFRAVVDVNTLDNNTFPIILNYPEHIKNVKLSTEFVKVKIKKRNTLLEKRSKK